VIEMRWIDREMRYPDPQVDPDDRYTERVLQYRYRYPEMRNAVQDYPPTEWVWSEWQDVPVERQS